MLSATNPSPQSELRYPEQLLSTSTRHFLTAAAPWRWFCTLTFARPIAAVPAHDAFRRWARFLARNLYGSHLKIAWAHGPQARGVIHFHALVAPIDGEVVPVDAGQIADAWHEGPDVDVQAVHDASGAARYLTRHPSWDLNVACDRSPRCRRGPGCLLAPGPWHPSGSIST